MPKGAARLLPQREAAFGAVSPQRALVVRTIALACTRQPSVVSSIARLEVAKGDASAGRACVASLRPAAACTVPRALLPTRTPAFAYVKVARAPSLQAATTEATSRTAPATELTEEPSRTQRSGRERIAERLVAVTA